MNECICTELKSYYMLNKDKQVVEQCMYGKILVIF